MWQCRDPLHEAESGSVDAEEPPDRELRALCLTVAPCLPDRVSSGVTTPRWTVPQNGSGKYSAAGRGSRAPNARYGRYRGLYPHKTRDAGTAVRPPAPPHRVALAAARRARARPRRGGAGRAAAPHRPARALAGPRGAD